MQKIRFIFCSVFVALLTFSFYINDVPEIHCPIEELAEEVEAGISLLLKDVEDDLAYVKNSRRGNTGSDNSIDQKSPYQFTQSELFRLEKKKKALYATDFELWYHDEISFLHRFQLF